MKSIKPHTKFIIIGNADEQHSINDFACEDDIIIRFNEPNSSCTLMADWVFIANGYTQIRHLRINHQFFKPDTEVFFRYSKEDIYQSCYEKIALHKRIKYRWRFPKWIKKYNLDLYKLNIVPKEIYLQTVDMIMHSLPSTGLLAINYVSDRFPNNQIFLHNFTYNGWSGHDWDSEKKLIQQWLDIGKLKNI